MNIFKLASNLSQKHHEKQYMKILKKELLPSLPNTMFFYLEPNDENKLRLALKKQNEIKIEKHSLSIYYLEIYILNSDSKEGFKIYLTKNCKVLALVMIKQFPMGNTQELLLEKNEEKFDSLFSKYKLEIHESENCKDSCYRLVTK